MADLTRQKWILLIFILTTDLKGYTASIMPSEKPVKAEREYVDFGQVFASIPASNTEDKDNVQKIHNFLILRVGTFLSNFDVTKFSTSGTLLRAIFEKLLSDETVKSNTEIYELISKYFPKITLEGAGAQRLEFNKNVTPTIINMTSTLKGMDVRSILIDGKINVFKRVLTFYKMNFPPALHRDKLQYDTFNTKGDFLIGFYKILKTLPGISSGMLDDISEIEKYVLKKGEGLAPLEFVKT